MTLEEFVLTYKDKDGNVVVNIADYYERFVKPLDDRFKNCSFFDAKLVLCCFKDHNDINPSMGTVTHRYLKGVRIYHCFGCGATGTVIRLHQRIQKEYFGRSLTDNESALELCELYDIDAGQFKTVGYEGDQANFMRRMQKVSELSNVYTSKEFSRDLLEIRKTPELGVDARANKVNSALIKYVATSKKLFDY